MGNPATVAQSFSLNETIIKKSNHSFILNEKDKKNTSVNKVEENQSLFSFEKKDQKTERAYEYALLVRYEKLGRSKNTIKGYKIFLEKGASFAKEIEQLCKISTGHSYRVLERLLSQELIKPLSKIKLKKTNGDKPVIYGLHNVTKEEEEKATLRYLMTRKKDYKHVDEVYQITLNDVIDQQIQFQKICWNARKHGNQNLHFLDIAELVAAKFQQEGIEVWRNI